MKESEIQDFWQTHPCGAELVASPRNPYSKVYDVAAIEKDFPAFEIVSTRKHFMHAPPLRVSWLPLGSLLGWHLWVTMKPRKTEVR